MNQMRYPNDWTLVLDQVDKPQQIYDLPPDDEEYKYVYKLFHKTIPELGENQP